MSICCLFPKLLRKYKIEKTYLWTIFIFLMEILRKGFMKNSKRCQCINNKMNPLSFIIFVFSGFYNIIMKSCFFVKILWNFLFNKTFFLVPSWWSSCSEHLAIHSTLSNTHNVLWRIQRQMCISPGPLEVLNLVRKIVLKGVYKIKLD